MNMEATKKVDEVIVSLCDYIDRVMKNDSVIDQDQLPSLIEALAKLVSSTQS